MYTCQVWSVSKLPSAINFYPFFKSYSHIFPINPTGYPHIYPHNQQTFSLSTPLQMPLKSFYYFHPFEKKIPDATALPIQISYLVHILLLLFDPLHMP